MWNRDPQPRSEVGDAWCRRWKYMKFMRTFPLYNKHWRSTKLPKLFHVIIFEQKSYTRKPWACLIWLLCLCNVPWDYIFEPNTWDNLWLENDFWFCAVCKVRDVKRSGEIITPKNIPVFENLKMTSLLSSNSGAASSEGQNHWSNTS